MARRCGVSLPLQVACLLHDVSHTAFSHVVDFALGDAVTQGYHDDLFERIALESEIPHICADHGVDFAQVLACKSSGLLKAPVPSLTFDRFDYFMRDGIMLGRLSPREARQIVAAVQLRDGELFFEDLDLAQMLSLTSQKVCFFGYASAAAYGSWSLLAEAAKAALAEGVICPDDFLLTDDELMIKLRTGGERVQKYLRRLNPRTEFNIVPWEKAEFRGPVKVRYVDPLVLRDGGLRALSEHTNATFEWLQERCEFVSVGTGYLA